MIEMAIQNGIEAVAQMMAIAATTAPKAGGQDNIRTTILTGDSVKELGEAMAAYGKRVHKHNFDRDGANVANSAAVVLIGIEAEPPTLGLDCGACGFPDCSALEAQERTDEEFAGPICAYKMLDMGIAIGSAVKTASLFNVDNRIMYRIGAVARDMGLVDWDFVMGIPLSVTGKSIYYDRK
jgi:uncharacterized ferredoxin-like protein